MILKSKSNPNENEHSFVLIECAGDELNEEGTEISLHMVDKGGM